MKHFCQNICQIHTSSKRETLLLVFDDLNFNHQLTHEFKENNSTRSRSLHSDI